MTSLPTTETSRAPQPERSVARPGSDASKSAAPPRGDLEGKTETAEARQSPDPLVATDRYRLNMPFADRL
ncbi:MAG: hypothetical protein U1F36_14680 [Planctomycetota bacterium]